ncbi:hypothetical protein [Geobacillus thermodenitrificans]|uniref:hypothetical protein n=1 Tax=Geobacillus thermodenitrificans TaxID=33940 RepID=UPI0009B1C7C3|nr:hypothetical protein [Geobacillus thermodenitrificans]ARA98620.1 hypothetical protein GD3902_11600 [Geobacillus thermodenitrificans]
MRTVNIGGKDIGLKATPLALLYYRQEFKSDLIGDLLKMQAIADDPSALDSIAILQVAWAMNKAAEQSKSFPHFESWLDQFEYVDFSDADTMTAIMNEARQGFFRGSAGGGAKRK